MRFHIHLTFHDFAGSDAVAARVYRKAEMLARFDVTHCRVVVEGLAEQASHPLRVRLEIEVPGGEILISRDASNVDAAVDAAFDAARLRLRERAQRGPAHGHSPRD